MIPTKSSKTKQLIPIIFLFLFIFIRLQLPSIIVIISRSSSRSYNSPFSSRKAYGFRACTSFEICQIFPIPEVCQRVVNPIIGTITTTSSLPRSNVSFTVDHESTSIRTDDRGYLYNTTTAYYNETPLASFDFRPTPGSPSEELEIRLPDAWGEEWFNLMLNDGRWVQSQDFFHDYFKGIAFIPDANDACISGFQVNDSSMCITVYYHQITETLNEKTLVFNTSSTLTYNKIEQDRSNIPIANLQSGDGNEYSSGKSEHQVYLQGMTGMYVTIDFPHLNNLCEKGELVTIESATLQLYPVKGTYDGMYPLPKSLALYTANNENVTQSVITDLTGSSVQSGNLVVDEMSYEETYYSFDITSFLQTNLGTTGYDRQKLQLFLPDNLFYTTLQGVIFGDGEHTANKKNTKLIILYKTYQQ